jgi:hypothetical protein
LSDCSDRLPKRGFIHLHLQIWLKASADRWPVEAEAAAMPRGAAGKENGEAAKE